MCRKEPLRHIARADDVYPGSLEYSRLLKEISSLISDVNKIVGWKIQFIPKQ
jgi:hypothetical protein